MELQKSSLEEISECTTCSVALRDKNFRMCERLRSWYLTDLAICDMWLLRVMFASRITPRFLQLSFGSRVTSSILIDGVATVLSIPFEPRGMNSDLPPLSFDVCNTFLQPADNREKVFIRRWK